eukprot:m.19897 g.19897  ORF g.19897 m.19897 type:complete len:464 (-) comp8095_c0_seq1:253-1644(-)
MSAAEPLLAKQRRTVQVEDSIALDQSRQGIHVPMPSSTQTRKRTRFVDREAAYHQSYGVLNIKRRVPTRASFYLRADDWFHTILSYPTWRLFLLLAALYTLVVVLWTGLFYAANESCDLRIRSFLDAFMLSIETMATIGYGVPDSYWNECIAGPFVLLSLCFVSLLLDALCIGVVFARMSRGTTRATTIVFSDKAVLRCIRNEWYMMFQVGELKKHQLLESHVRMYAVQHSEAAVNPPDSNAGSVFKPFPSTIAPSSSSESESDDADGHDVPLRSASSTSALLEDQTKFVPVYFQTHLMRVQHPNDELGGMLLLAMPNVVVHKIDQWSPLFPQHLLQHGQQPSPSTEFLFPNSVLRSCDLAVGAREPKDEATSQPPTIEADDILEHMASKNTEVLCVIEGVDSSTAFTVQARHSYTAEDMEPHHTFAPCVFKSTDGGCVIDYHRFHDLITDQGLENHLPQTVL